MRAFLFIMTPQKFKRLYEIHLSLSDLFYELVNENPQNESQVMKLGDLMQDFTNLYDNNETMGDFHFLDEKPSLEKAYFNHENYKD